MDGEHETVCKLNDAATIDSNKLQRFFDLNGQIGWGTGSLCEIECIG
jgi:hypothetical protein